jgi:nuclear receptor subfamily 1 group F protein 4
MSRYYDVSSGSVLYGDTMLPQDAFFTTDTTEMKLVTNAFELARAVAELKLTENELALYSGYVLLSAGKYNLYTENNALHLLIFLDFLIISIM